MDGWKVSSRQRSNNVNIRTEAQAKLCSLFCLSSYCKNRKNNLSPHPNFLNLCQNLAFFVITRLSYDLYNLQERSCKPHASIIIMKGQYFLFIFKIVSFEMQA